jgi:hypothetical protein
MRHFRWVGPALALICLVSGLATGGQEEIYWGDEVPEKWNGDWPEKFQTIPEKTDFKKTTSSYEILEFIDTLKWNSENVHVFTMFISELRRQCPVVVMSNPRITSPQEAKKSGKPVIYLQGNIHPPEAEGKEALLMVMRDILLGDKKHLLDDQIILCCPNFNVDGNDSWGLRDGTPHIIGTRQNARGYDLNRDAIKLETTNVQGLYRTVLNRWNPVLVFDAHAMGRVQHGYAIVYATSTVPAAHPGPRGYVWDTLFPAMRKAIRENFQIETFSHCLFPRNQWPPKVWSHDLAYWTTEGKFVTAAYGLRNRMSILVETPGDPVFERKIYAHYALVSELLEYTNRHGREMQEVCRAADQEVVDKIKSHAPSGELKNYVAGKYESWGKIDLLAYPENEYEYIPGTSVQRKKPGTLEATPQVIKDVEHLTKPVGTREATVPRGYLIPAGLDYIADKLRLQNIEVKVLERPITVRGEEYAIDKIIPVQRGGYAMIDLKGEFVRFESKTFPAGTYMIDLAQPHANLAFYCLEPEVGDGLAGWGFFNDALKSLGAGKERVTFPVHKYFEVIGESE